MSTKFTLSTKPLKNSLGLAIIDANVSQFVSKSTVVQIEVADNKLHIITEASAITSMVELAGTQDGDPASMLIDAVLFKKLVSTITAQQITLELTDNYIIVYAGKSKFNLPKLGGTDQMSLNKPTKIEDSAAETAKVVDKKVWKFVHDHQLFAKATSPEIPIYTYVYAGDSGDVLVSDYKKSIFTHSSVGNSPFDEPVLITDTIVNLFTAVPDGAKIVPNTSEGSYIVLVSTDGYTYTAEFFPQYENGDLGNYNAETFIPLFSVVDKPVSTVQVSDVKAMIVQASLLSNTRDNCIRCTVDPEQVTFSADNVNCVIPSNGGPDSSYSLDLDFTQFKSIVSSAPSATINISPVEYDGSINGITLVSDSLTVVIAGVGDDS